MIATPSARSLVLFLCLCLLATSSTFGQPQVAHVDITDQSVIWSPFTTDEMVLTVSGPSGDFRFEVEAGEAATFDVFDKHGAVLQDGSYTWQLITLPSVSDATRDAMQKARAEGAPFGSALPQGLTQSGAFKVRDGYFVLPTTEAANRPTEGTALNKDQVVADDLIVQQSACIGQGCVNGEVFGLDTLRLKDDNPRIQFQDTSPSGSFPSNDWGLVANDTASGGLDKFSIDDLDGGRTPFTIEAGAPSHSLYVDDGGRVGVGTSTPMAEVHVVDGESPTLRLEQDGSNGFAPQTWDMAGNEAYWSVRDVTNGSRLPFKIIQGAPTNALVIDTDGDVGLGTSSPDASLHVAGDDGNTQLLIEDNNTSFASFDGMLKIDSAATNGTVSVMNIVTAGARPRFTMIHGNTASGITAWNMDILNTTGNLAFIRGGIGGPVFTFDANNGDFTIDDNPNNPNQVGNIRIPGSFISSGITLSVPDYVFDDDYDLMPLDEVKAFIDKKQHLPEVPSAAEVKAEGLDVTHMQMTLLKKVEELTLYTLDQHETIRGLRQTNRDHQDTIRDQQNAIQELVERMEALEAALQ